MTVASVSFPAIQLVLCEFVLLGPFGARSELVFTEGDSSVIDASASLRDAKTVREQSMVYQP